MKPEASEQLTAGLVWDKTSCCRYKKTRCSVGESAGEICRKVPVPMIIWAFGHLSVVDSLSNSCFSCRKTSEVFANYRCPNNGAKTMDRHDWPFERMLVILYRKLLAGVSQQVKHVPQLWWPPGSCQSSTAASAFSGLGSVSASICYMWRMSSQWVPELKLCSEPPPPRRFHGYPLNSRK